ncbi:MAG: uridine kinase [Candidatus Palauibacterales bacterium]|jgi:uridine kinase|nr:uridine kinase [Candidatus Palauibacterales bacterium]
MTEQPQSLSGEDGSAGQPDGGRPRRPLVVGVAGGSGSGKTTVVKRLLEGLEPTSASLLHHDSYYRDSPELTLEQRAAINYDHPDSLETPLMAEHLRMLLAGHAVEVPQYDFTVHRRMAETRRVEPRPLIIVDGILVLAEPELRELMDIRVFVDTDSDIRFIRRLGRDTKKRGRTVESVIRQYQQTVRPMHLEFVAPSRRHAHIIVPEGGKNEVAISMLVARLRYLVARGT